jgi:hypothetical protein
MESKFFSFNIIVDYNKIIFNLQEVIVIDDDEEKVGGFKKGFILPPLRQQQKQQQQPDLLQQLEIREQQLHIREQQIEAKRKQLEIGENVDIMLANIRQETSIRQQAGNRGREADNSFQHQDSCTLRADSIRQQSDIRWVEVHKVPYSTSQGQSN